ncbi:hypothetical protein [Krasilnikovia cinnamomea]|uniref:hypothetical protein n=1 Tax=Krasilnikovia cinnamomea TaxID=349313 RepID=UPI001F5FC4E5|nr:hypothetical protein [Krasilnikovia cinnamomea]
MVAFAGGVLVAGLGAFLVVEGLDKADKWASVFGLFVGLAGLGLAVAGTVGGRRHAGGQSVTDSTIGGGVAQVRGVRSNVRIGPGTAPPAAAAAAASPSAPSASASSPSGGDGDGQSVTRSSTAGPVRQVDDVGGDVELDR